MLESVRRKVLSRKVHLFTVKTTRKGGEWEESKRRRVLVATKHGDRTSNQCRKGEVRE